MATRYHYLTLTIATLLTAGMRYAGGSTCRTATNAALMGYKGRVKQVVETTYRIENSRQSLEESKLEQPQYIKTITFDKNGKVLTCTHLDVYNKRTTTSTYTWPGADSMVTDNLEIGRRYEPYDTAMQRYTRQWLGSNTYRETYWKTERQGSHGGYSTTLETVETVTLDAQCRKVKADMETISQRVPFHVFTNVTYKRDSTITVYTYSAFSTVHTGRHCVRKRDAHGNPTNETDVDFNGDKLIITQYEYY